MSGELEKRASDLEREQVVARLREASAQGRLTLEELADRTALAYEARSRAELERVVGDLPVAPVIPRRKPVRWTVVVIGNAKRRGHWRVAERTRVLVGIGDVEVDLREAQLEAQAVTLTIVLGIGDVTVVVPRHVDVEMSGIVLIGGKHERGSEEPIDGAPLVRVRVVGLVGEVKVDRR